MHRISEAAILLQRFPMGESDWRLILLCQHTGKISAVAPGARRSKKRFAGVLDLFCELDLVAVERRRGGLWRMEEARLLQAHAKIREDLVAIAHAGYVTELVDAMVREGQEDPEPYALLGSLLTRLEQGPLTGLDLRRVELQMLEQAGVAPSLDNCLACGTRQARSWAFDHDQGGLVCPACPKGPHREELGQAEVDLLRDLQAGRSGMAETKANQALIRRLLARLLDAQIGRPLKAREFLRQLARSKEHARTRTGGSQ